MKTGEAIQTYRNALLYSIGKRTNWGSVELLRMIDEQTITTLAQMMDENDEGFDAIEEV